MRNSTINLARSIVVLALCTALGVAKAEDDATPTIHPELASVLQDLSRSAPPDAYRQVVDAIAHSPTLAREFDELAGHGALTRIDVVPPTGPGTAAMRGLFGAAVDGSRVVLSTALMTALRKNRLFDVVQPNEVLPDNTVFVLVHLAHHLAHPVGMPGIGDTMPQWVARRLADEALAYIESWNATVEDATLRSGGASLSAQQAGSLLLNCRYRFAFLGGKNRQPAGPTLDASGMIAASPANIDAIVAALTQSSVADLE